MPLPNLPEHDTPPPSFCPCDDLPQFCVCPETESLMPKTPLKQKQSLADLLADLAIAIELIAAGAAKAWRNDETEAGITEARRIVKEMRGET